MLQTSTPSVMLHVTFSVRVDNLQSQIRVSNKYVFVNSTRILLIYIIGHYNLSVRITAQLLTQLMLCALILYVSGGTFNLTSTPNNKFFEELLHGSFICSQSSCQKSDERKCRRNVFFFFIFRFDANPGFTSNKSTHYLLDYGDSNISWSEILRHPEIWKHCQFFSHFISI